MNSNLYIPATITVGFQTRSDTFTGKLGYVIYTDHTGKLRKEGSWNSWRDHKLEPITVNNDPTTGFTLNKGVQRDGHWGSGRSVVRVWDPRNFEFEVSIDNLIGILMHSDVSKRDITEPCVFAWNGTELILLPTNSVEYQQSVEHTERQKQQFSAKDLVIGYTYVRKIDNEKLAYLGRLDQYTITMEYNEHYSNGYRGIGGRDGYVIQSKRKSAKGHVFMEEDNTVVVLNPSRHISSCEIDHVHPEFASKLDAYYRTNDSQPMVGITVVPNKANSHSYTPKWIKNSEKSFIQLNVAHSTVCVGSVGTWDGEKFTCAPAQPSFRPSAEAQEKIAAINTWLSEQQAVGSSHSRTNASTLLSQYSGKNFEYGSLHAVLADGQITSTYLR